MLRSGGATTLKKVEACILEYMPYTEINFAATDSQYRKVMLKDSTINKRGELAIAAPKLMRTLNRYLVSTLHLFACLATLRFIS